MLKLLETQQPPISIENITTYLPELGLETGFVLAARLDYDPTRDWHAANIRLHEPQRRLTAVDACIVDGGEVIQVATTNTDDLLAEFGRSERRQASRHPVLCKVPNKNIGSIVLPVIGHNTARLCIENGIRAIAIKGQGTIVMQRSEVLELAKAGSIGIYAL